MRLQNGYYGGAEGAICTYCNNSYQSTCSNECISESLTSANMKLLTSKAKSMIGNAVWDTYGVKWSAGGVLDSNWAPTAYLEEKGISAQNTGKNLYVEAKGSDYIYCNDSVERTTSWTGLVRLMSVSDITYANGWLYNQGSYTYPWSISSFSNSSYGSQAWHSYDEKAVYTQTSAQFGVFPSLYLNSDIKIIGGNGDDRPYILK